MKRLLVAVMAVASILILATPASAHQFATTGWVDPPDWDGRTWYFRGHHRIDVCSNTGDSTKCSQGAHFRIYVGAEIWAGYWVSIGEIVTSTRHYPEYTQTNRTYTLACTSGDAGRTYTMRSRGRAGLQHNGVWQLTGWFYSNSRTHTCPNSALSVDEGGVSIAELLAQAGVDPSQANAAPPAQETGDPGKVVRLGW